MAISKKILLNSNVLLEYIYDDNNTKSQDYSIISNLNDDTRNYVSKTLPNTIDNNLFTVDSVLKRYSKINLDNFNFLHEQNYAGYYTNYDKIKIYFPISYNFPVYFGFNIKFYTLNYNNTKIHNICNYFYDKTKDSNIGTIDLITPFTFNENMWGKCITLDIPSIYKISRERIITTSQNTVIPNTINYNLTNGIGLSQSTPIFIDFSWITAINDIIANRYYTLGDTYEVSVPQQPEYQSLGVEIIESNQGDFFEIYGIYQGTNELIDNFVSDLESSGKRIQLEYTITLFEEGIQSGFPQTLVISENFAQKILYRPIIRYSNTTAAIDVKLNIIDLVNNSQIERFASIGLTKNIFKYGRILSSINLNGSVMKPKIYKAAPDTIVMNNPTIYGSGVSGNTNITKVPYPVLYSKYKLLVNSTSSTNTEYLSNGLLNLIITPFDNVIKFTIAKSIDNYTNTPVVYDLSEILTNASLKLVFKSDGKILEKNYYAQASENNLKLGIIIYKIDESDLSTLKEIYNKGFKNFYLTLYANNTKSMMYSGKFDFSENIKYISNNTQTTQSTTSTNNTVTTNTNLTTTESVNKTSDQLSVDVKTITIDEQVSSNSQLNKSNIPATQPSVSVKNNRNYFNLMIFINKSSVLKNFEAELNALGIKSWIYNDYVYYVSGIHILTVQKIEKLLAYIKKVIRIDIYDGQNQGSSNINTTITEDQISTVITENASKLSDTTNNVNTSYLDPTTGKTINK